MTTAPLVGDEAAALAARLADARRRTDEIFDSILRPDALYERPIPERHRLVFYLGHLEAFDWNLIGRRVANAPAFHPAFDRLFAFGIDPVDGGLPSEPASDWPSRRDVEGYVGRTRETLDRLVASADLTRPEWERGTILHVAIEHRLMHAETLAYLLHQLPTHLKNQPDAEPPVEAPRMRAGRARIPAGRATLGRRRGEGFGWDNEFEAHVVDVPAFSIDVLPVSNGDFMEFVKVGGYRERRFWSTENWLWRERAGVHHPPFWQPRDDAWYLRGMFATRRLPLETPVYVSHAEASAYARWKGAELPTEPQFHRAAYGTPDGAEREYPWGDGPPEARHGNFDFARWEPTPAGSHPDGASAFGVAELVGNGWEWTSSVFEPFPGFEPFPFYAGYSANFFDGLHYVMKGGSPRTAACMLRRSFRNWFQPRYGYVYGKFRLVRNA